MRTNQKFAFVSILRLHQIEHCLGYRQISCLSSVMGALNHSYIEEQQTGTVLCALNEFS